MSMKTEVTITKGAISVDDRGTVSFVNDFKFEDVKRFYTVENHTRNFVRAWHGHRNESKYVMVVQGSAIITAIPLINFDTGFIGTPEIYRYVLSEKTPAVIKIPGGFANGFKSLTDNTKIMFFSTATLEETKNDDIRFSADIYKDVWNILER